MQPGFSGDTHVLPKARLKPLANSHPAEHGEQLQPDNRKNVTQSYGTDANASSNVAQESELRPSLPLFNMPKRRAASPYRPISERADIKLQELIYHYTTVVATLTVTPVGPRHEWFPFAAVDEALFHAVMSHTAAHSAYLRKVPLQNEPDYFWHTGQAIRLVNARLGEGIYKAATDGTICAVCCLTQQQAFAGQIANTRMHLNGLITLVQAARGLQSPALNPKTRRFILLTDLATSITLQKGSHFTPTFVPGHFTLYFGPASTSTAVYARTLSTRLFNFTDAAELSQRARDLFWGLRNLSLLLEDIRAGRASADTANAQDLQFTDRVEVLERLAQSLSLTEHLKSPTPQSPLTTKGISFQSISSSPPCPSPIDPPTSLPHTQPLPPTAFATTKPNATTIFTLLGHATLIYIYTTLRELPPQLGMLKLVSTRITGVLERMGAAQQNLLFGTFQDLMVWVMFVGGSVAAPREKIVLAKMMSRVLLVSRCESEEGIVEATQRFLWPEVGGRDVCAWGAAMGGGEGRVAYGGHADAGMVMEGELLADQKMGG